MKIVKGFVNPMKGWANNPYIVLKIEGRYSLPPNPIYTNSEACYWYQNSETGLTDFFFHTALEECHRISETKYLSPPSEGFGGRTFTLNLSEGGSIDLIGPWSGGSYCANRYLPEPTIEIAFKQDRFSYIAGHMTWRKVQDYLPPGWSVADSKTRGSHWPELIYLDLFKKDWSPEMMEYLYNEFQKTDKETDG